MKYIWISTHCTFDFKSSFRPFPRAGGLSFVHSFIFPLVHPSSHSHFVSFQLVAYDIICILSSAVPMLFFQILFVTKLPVSPSKLADLYDRQFGKISKRLSLFMVFIAFLIRKIFSSSLARIRVAPRGTLATEPWNH